ncbi:uncharacterized protein AB675_9038 [Cyphellophora attinorum]|uniref:Uncharacterized protein n=1 Tax=Cyphellophora attinorum TaxID=1664694 RepID=A0A0N1NZG1_9EURO|nr:uncharacterized protein AB675_9038 [Phialophora attinorum]KPI41515.1 hypothetical protein AB675_9038 [Phialophora attinorum]
MASPLAHKTRRKEVLNLRDSTFAPTNLLAIPRMNTRVELAEMSANLPSPHSATKPIVKDFGYFKTGTPSYGHAHWDKDQLARKGSMKKSDSKVDITTDSLQSDADSVHAEIENGSTTSLARLSLSPSTTAGSEITIRRTRPNNDHIMRILRDNGEQSDESSGNSGTPGRTRPNNDHIMRILRDSTNQSDDQVISILEAAFEGPTEEAPATPAEIVQTPSRKSLGSWGKKSRTSTVGTNGSVCSSTPTATNSGKRVPSNGLREAFSTIFRRDSVAGSNASKTPVQDKDKAEKESPGFSSKKFAEDRELYLRTITASLPHGNTNMYPKHPFTNKPWMHRNLRCTTCTDECCNRCGRACCAHRAAVLGLKNHPTGENHFRARGRLTELEKMYPYGRELPTFIKCLECEKLMCPECCGECAEPICKSVVCRGCKSDPWVNCDWH